MRGSAPTARCVSSQGVVLSSSGIAMGKFSPTTRHGDCEEIANLSTAFGRRRRNWIGAHGLVPAGQAVDASCGNEHCIALRHCYLHPRVEQPGRYRKIAPLFPSLLQSSRITSDLIVPGRICQGCGFGTDNRKHSLTLARLRRTEVKGNGVGNRLARIGVVGVDFATFSGTPQFCLHG